METAESILLDKPNSAAQTQQSDNATPPNGSDYEPHPKLMSFRGRARRKEYWDLMLGTIIFVVIVSLSCMPLVCSKDCSTTLENSVLAVVFGLLIVGVVFTLPVSVRRLHDRNMSGWWMLWFWLLGLIPFVGFFSGIVQFVIMGCLDGTPGPNRYGPDPKGRNFPQQGNTSIPAGSVNATPEERIRKLKAMMDDGIISKIEYEEKRAKLLAQI